jgi:hypothetical protein
MRVRLGLLTLAAVALLAPSASAEPYKTTTLDAGTPTFDWDGSGSGISKPIGLVGEPSNLGCGAFPAGNDCQDVLVKMGAKGDLTVTLEIDGATTVDDPTGTFGSIAGYPDIDIYPYAADASGAPTGDPLSTDGATAAGTETFTLKGLAAGSYVLEVEFFNGVDATYTAKAVGSNFPAPVPVEVTPTVQTPPPAAAPAPAPAAQPAPASSPAKPAAKKKTSKKAACVKKAKKIKKKAKRAKALKRCKKLRA